MVHVLVHFVQGRSTEAGAMRQRLANTMQTGECRQQGHVDIHDASEPRSYDGRRQDLVKCKGPEISFCFIKTGRHLIVEF